MANFKLSTLCNILLFCLIGLISCQKEKEPELLSSTAKNYLNEVINQMKTYSINRKTIDWTGFKAKVEAQAQGAQTIADTYPAIQLALTLLSDNHSVYLTSAGTAIYGGRTVACTDATPTIGTIDKRIGYVKITGFNGSGSEAVKFAQSIQDAIKAADSDSLKGWIVDLRGNLGGNMWPMVAGAGPLLGEGICGYFQDPDGNVSTWSYQQGSSLINQTVATKVESVYTPRKSNLKIAVLTDKATASSGEAVAIAFKGRLNTRSFGRATCGLSTANGSLKLSDGATLILTQSTMADRNKKAYGEPVQVDEVAPDEMVTVKAVTWLLQ